MARSVARVVIRGVARVVARVVVGGVTVTDRTWRWTDSTCGRRDFSSSRRRTWTFWKANTPKPTLAKNVLRATRVVSLPMPGSWQRRPLAARLDLVSFGSRTDRGDPHAGEAGLPCFGREFAGPAPHRARSGGVADGRGRRPGCRGRDGGPRSGALVRGRAGQRGRAGLPERVAARDRQRQRGRPRGAYRRGRAGRPPAAPRRERGLRPGGQRGPERGRGRGLLPVLPRRRAARTRRDPGDGGGGLPVERRRHRPQARAVGRPRSHPPGRHGRRQDRCPEPLRRTGRARPGAARRGPRRVLRPRCRHARAGRPVQGPRRLRPRHRAARRGSRSVVARPCGRRPGAGGSGRPRRARRSARRPTRGRRPPSAPDAPPPAHQPRLLHVHQPAPDHAPGVPRCGLRAGPQHAAGSIPPDLRRGQRLAVERPPPGRHPLAPQGAGRASGRTRSGRAPVAGAGERSDVGVPARPDRLGRGPPRLGDRVGPRPGHQPPVGQRPLVARGLAAGDRPARVGQPFADHRWHPGHRRLRRVPVTPVEPAARVVQRLPRRGAGLGQPGADVAGRGGRPRLPLLRGHGPAAHGAHPRSPPAGCHRHLADGPAPRLAPGPHRGAGRVRIGTGGLQRDGPGALDGPGRVRPGPMDVQPAVERLRTRARSGRSAAIRARACRIGRSSSASCCSASPPRSPPWSCRSLWSWCRRSRWSSSWAACWSARCAAPGGCSGWRSVAR